MTRGALAAAAAVLLLSVPQAEACSETVAELRGPFGTAQFNVDVADEPQERSRGLMFVEQMPQSRGMLFLYDRPQRATFWMKNTLIPLDMIFADATGRVTHVHENAIPLDETTIDGGNDVLAILEINGGLAGAIGIAPGAELRHPGLDQDTAAWPCD